MALRDGSSDFVTYDAYFRTPEEGLHWVEVAFDELIELFGFHECGLGDSHSKEDTAPIRTGDDLVRYLRERRRAADFYGRGCEGGITLMDKFSCTEAGWLFKSLDDPRIVKYYDRVFRGFAAGGAWYGRACCWSEYEARHDLRFVTTYEGRKLEDGVRLCTDIHRYVPGLLWLNYFSHDYCTHIGIDVEEVVRLTGAARHDYPEGVLIKLYEHPTDWPKHNARVQKAIDALPYVFSLNWVPRPPAGMTPKEARLWREKLHKEHPEWW